VLQFCHLLLLFLSFISWKNLSESDSNSIVPLCRYRGCVLDSAICHRPCGKSWFADVNTVWREQTHFPRRHETCFKHAVTILFLLPSQAVKMDKTFLPNISVIQISNLMNRLQVNCFDRGKQDAFLVSILFIPL